MWFETTPDGMIQFISAPGSLRVRRLGRDPRASLVVAAPVGERERWVSVAGPTTVETGGAHELYARLAARYWDLDDPARAGDLAEVLAQDWVRVVLQPETVHRFAF